MKKWLIALVAVGFLFAGAGVAWAGEDCHQSEKSATSGAEALEAPAEAKEAGCQADGGCCGVGACAGKEAKAAAADGEAAGACPCGRGNKAKQEG